MLCQLHIPGRGPVLASTLNGDYVRGMDPSLWRNFHIHSAVGTCADGRPLVSADSEHFNATLTGTTVTGSGPVRDTSMHVSRSFTFEGDAIRCHVQLDQSRQLNLLNLWTNSKLHGRVTEAFEMIPFVANKVRQLKKPVEPTSVTLLDERGAKVGDLTETAIAAKTIVIDRGGFGVRVELNEPHNVTRGDNSTVLIELVREFTPTSEVGLEYRLVPFIDAAE